RAAYLLTLLGRSGDDDRGGSGHGAKDPMFLMMVMEQREALEAVDMAADDAADRLDAVRQEVDQRIVAEERAIAAAFAQYDDDPREEVLDTIAGLCDRLRYHNRFLEEVERKEEALFE
ncbi:MAG: hypothetical protein HQL53_11665, partial [Magnetococcales bacterium]|nr:hypothetical protein [Magnetococcales bacterium]